MHILTSVQAWFAAKAERSERGSGLVEYALLLAFIAIVGIPAVTLLGENIAAIFGDIAAAL